MSSDSSRENSPRRYRRPASPRSDDELFNAAKSLSSFRATPRTVQQQHYASDYPQHSHRPSSSYQSAGPPSTSYQQAGSASTYQSAGSSSMPYSRSGPGSGAYPSTTARTSESYPTTHPSSTSTSQPAAPPSSSRPPASFSYNTPTTVPYSSSRPTQTVPQPSQSTGYDVPQPEKSSKKKSSGSKGKEKEKDKHKSSSSSSKKHKDRDPSRAQNPYTAATSQAPGPPPSSHYPMPQPPIPGTQTAFRVHSYVNDPRAGPSPTPSSRGPYSSDFRATPPVHPDNSASASSHRTSTHGPPVPMYGGPAVTSPGSGMSYQDEERRSYYRHDYEKQRDSAPANRRQTTSSGSSARHDSPAYAHPSSHHTSAPPPSAAAYTYPEPSVHHSSNSHDYVPPPPYRAPSPVPEYAHYEPPSFQMEHYRAHSPGPPASNRHSSPDRHHRSRSHRHEQESYSHRDTRPPSYRHSSPPPRSAEVYVPRPESGYAAAPPPPPSAPKPVHVSSLELGGVPTSTRVLRTLTLLVEDQRRSVAGPNGEPVSMLAEVRVPLKQADNPEDGYWANAQEVSDELQAGPSRIDGRAKVYAMRGRFRQYFLRITPENGLECDSANLKSSLERVLELFVEDLPPVTTAPPAPSQAQGQSQAYPYASPRYERRPLTPVADSAPAPPPPPARMVTPPRLPPPVPAHQYYSTVGEQTPTSAPRYHYESDPPPRKPKKRHRSPRSSIVSYAPPPSEVSAAAAIPYERQQRRYESPPSGYESGAHMSSVAPTSPPSSRYSPVSYSKSPPPPASAPTVHVIPPSRRMSPSPTPRSQYRASEFQGYHSDTTPLPGPSSPKKARHRREEGGSSGATEYRRRTPPMQTAVPSISYTHPPVPMPSASSSYRPPSATVRPPSASYPPPARTPIFTPPPAQSPVATASGASGLALPTPSQATENPTTKQTSASNAPGAPSQEPTIEYSEEVNMAVGMYLRGLFTKDTGWDAFVKGRNSRLKMSQQLDQYRYVTGKFDEYVGMKTSADVAGAAGVTINKTQVMKAFNLPVSWAEEGLEALALTGMYGPGGSRSEDAKVVAMLDEVPPTTTGIQLKKFLSLLREIHSRWTIEHP